MMSKSTLSSELQAMVPEMSEAQGIENFAKAFRAYFAESEVNLVPALEIALDPCETTMIDAMTGLANVDGPGAISAGIAAWWVAASGIADLIWPAVLVPTPSTATPPPGLTTLTAGVTATGAANIASELSLDDSADAMAATIHAANAGGIFVNTLIPVSFPIL